jgi:hypothetical protein
MKRSICAVILVLLGIGLGAGNARAYAAGVQVRAVRHKKDVIVTQAETLSTSLLMLVQSCSVNSTKHAASGSVWRRLLSSDSFVHVTFSEPRSVRVSSGDNGKWEEQEILEILLPLPEHTWPAHVFVKSQSGTLSFTKYDNRALKRVVADTDLQLTSTPPYDQLLKEPRGGRPGLPNSQ